MPLFRAGSKLLYYVHIPKCGGTSMTEYLERRFGPPALQDRKFLKRPAAHPWSRTSPQHIDRDSLQRLMPRSFYDEAFAIVRHPVRRALSVYQFRRRQENIPRWMTFGLWLSILRMRKKLDPFVFDNHARPQVDFIPPRTRIFRLEDGLGPVIEWLDETFGPAEADLVIGHEKRAAERLEPTPAEVRQIRRMYARDFKALGYAE